MAFGRKSKQKERYDTGFSQQDLGQPQRARLTPVDVQQKVFRLAFRGYNEQDVDQFLDEITEDLAALHEENKRLREELELRGSGGGVDEARRHAEEIIRRAREEAARMTAGAEAADASAAATPAFLVREREFLQQLASLVQGHAETLKEEARRVRSEGSGDAAPDEGGNAGSRSVSEASATPEPEPEPEREPEPEPEREPEREPEPEPERSSERPPEPEPESEPARRRGPVLEETQAMDTPPARDEASEWSNPFEEHASSDDVFVDRPSGGSDEDEPSLRELFWGEE